MSNITDGLTDQTGCLPQLTTRQKCIGWSTIIGIVVIAGFFITMYFTCRGASFDAPVFKKICHFIDFAFNSTNDQRLVLTINPILDPCKLEGQGCQNGGTCLLMDDDKRVKCQCTEAYTGNQCEVAITTATEPPTIKPCSIANPCQNGGTCQQSGNRLTCLCTQDYVGHLCDKAAPTMETFAPHDPCRVMPCSNGGSCVRDGQSYICECPVGIVGDRCEEQEEPSVGGGNNGRSSKKSWVVILIALTVIGIIVVVYLTRVKGRKRKQKPKRGATRSVQPPSRVVQRPTY